MRAWTQEDLYRLDAKYAAEGVHLHQRPFRAAVDLLGGQFSIGVGGNPEVDDIMAAYRQLVPEVTTTWPGMGIGFAVSVDQVRKLTLGVPMGTVLIEPWQAGFESQDAWWRWCRQDRSIASEACFAFADIFDFFNGRDEIAGKNPAADRFWSMAASNLEDVANALPSSFSVDSVIQPICMVAELSLKAALVWDGADPAQFKGAAGHHLTSFSSRLTTARPHRDDAAMNAVVSKLPPYVASRYAPAGLTRLHVVRLALGVQFLAASTMRRIASTDVAAQMEADEWPGRRPSVF